MTQTKISIVGTLRLTDESGLQFSLPVKRKDGTTETLWLEAVDNVSNWPGLGECPKKPEAERIPSYKQIGTNDPKVYGKALGEWSDKNKKAEEEWNRAREAYFRNVHSDPKYLEAAKQFLKATTNAPQELIAGLFWAYRGNVLKVVSGEPEPLRDKQKDIVMIKHYVLRRERQYERARREVEALENMEKLEGTSRAPIPDSVRLFVWQRDKGQCVKCGSRELLEFDHVIPVIAGGSNTERNIQLLCESCNRSKGPRFEHHRKKAHEAPPRRRAHPCGLVSDGAAA